MRLASLLLLSLAACSTSTPPPADDSPDASPPPPVPDAGVPDAGPDPDPDAAPPVPCTIDDPTGLRPYLQNVTEDAIWISWKTADGTEARVEYGTSPDALDQSATGSVQELASDYHYHAVHLTGLAPATRYYYRVAGEDQVFHFRTARPLGTATGHFRFLVFGDHQIRNEDRHTRMVRGAFEKVQELYGCDVDDAIDVILNVGDQVDVGTLDHWEHIHFGQSALISPYIAQMTLIGNHETYSDPGLANYRAHFFYDQTSYNGRLSPDNELYYAFHLGSVVFLMLDSEHTGNPQADWAEGVISEARADAEVRWIISLSHRPLQAEQFVGDVSPFMRDRIVPMLTTTEKAALFIGAHHHLYARGQHRDQPLYEIISGGTAWDQVWGQSNEVDFDDVQKTIDFWAYQIVDIDLDNQEMVVDTYAVGSPRLGFTLDNERIDHFHRKFGVPSPATPSIQSPPTSAVELPHEFVSSPFQTSTGELNNSTQFQISQSPSFSTLEVDLLRDYEDYFGTTGAPDWRTIDKNADVDIFRCELGPQSLVSGNHYLRVRHRDRNLAWSAWSNPVTFEVTNGGSGTPSIAVPKTVYAPGEAIPVTYTYGPGGATDWIGVYRAGQTPGGVGSEDWNYVSGPSGVTSVVPTTSGRHFIAYFRDDGYQEVAPRVEVYVGAAPTLTTSKPAYASGETVSVSFSGAPGGAQDWIGIYRAGQVPGATPPVRQQAVTGASATLTFNGLADGYYFVAYFVDGEPLAISERVTFSVGSPPATIQTDQTSYTTAEPIVATFAGGPATPKDYVGIFPAGGTPGVSILVSYRYVGGVGEGSVTFPAGEVPPGNYFLALYINDTYTEVSPRVSFTVQ